MTTKTISGTITTGYTLSPTYSALTITHKGAITGALGALGVNGLTGGTGGVGLTVTFAASIGNAGHLHGGQGGAGVETRKANGHYYYSNGGGGGAAVYLKSAIMTNTGVIIGGYGGVGSGEGANYLPDGDGGAGGAGAIVGAGALLTNSAILLGGLGGLGGGSAFNYNRGAIGAKGGNGGDGVDLQAGGRLSNTFTIVGGNGASGGYTPDVSGKSGAGGAGVVSAASGGLTNTGVIQGGAGAASQEAGLLNNQSGDGGAGGVGLQYDASASFTNAGRIAGGVGGAGASPSLNVWGGQGGAGIDLAAGGVLTNNGTILGGDGGPGGIASGQYSAGDGGGGSAGINLYVAGTIVNTNVITGGAGGQGGDGYSAGNGGEAGAGVVFFAGGSLSNTGTITTQNPGAGGTGRYNGYGGAQNDGVVFQGAGTIVNGSAPARILGGAVGVYAGAGSALTLTNAGTIAGGSGVSVLFKASADRLIVDAGSTWQGAVQGGGGTLELANGTSTVNGLGSSATLSGGESLTFSGFGAYAIDYGATLSLTGTNTLGANQTLNNAGNLTVTGSLANAGRINGNLATDQGTIANLGSITNGVGMNGGRLINGSTGDAAAQITAGDYAVYANTSGPATVINFGTIAETGVSVNNTGIWLNGGGVVINGSGLDGYATISGMWGVYMSGVGTVTNYGAINGLGGVAVALYNSADRLIVEAGSHMTGQARSAGGTLELVSGAVGTIVGLGTTGTISGGNVAMTVSGFGTYQLDTGTRCTLLGANNLSADRTLTLAAGAAITNKGALTSAGTLSLSGVLIGPGSLAISGGAASIGPGASLTLSTVSLTGGATSLTENLTYKGAFTEGSAATLTLGSKNRLTLSGAATLGGLINGAGTVMVANATVSGLTIGGTDVLSDTGKATQTGSVTIGDATSAKAGMSIAAGATWTINGAVGIAHGTATNSSLTVAGTLIKSGATGTSVINLITTDTGLIEVAAGTLDLAGKLAGTGVLKIDAGATLEVDTNTASSLTANFNGAGATLALKAPTKFAATISGLAVGDTIDLLKIAATGATINGRDQLVIVNGANTVTTLKLTGPYSGATFTVGSDGKGGTNLTLLTAARSPSPTGLIAAMAGLAAGTGSALVAGAHVGPPTPMLLTRA